MNSIVRLQRGIPAINSRKESLNKEFFIDPLERVFRPPTTATDRGGRVAVTSNPIYQCRTKSIHRSVTYLQ